jgi:glycosyltransferase involved in cell wall biosynthesis
VLTLNTPDNAYSVRNAGVLYELSVENLRQQMRGLLESPQLVAEKRRLAIERATEEYLWEVVTDKYEEVLSRLAALKRRRRKAGSSTPATVWDTPVADIASQRQTATEK